MSSWIAPHATVAASPRATDGAERAPTPPRRYGSLLVPGARTAVPLASAGHPIRGLSPIWSLLLAVGPCVDAVRRKYPSAPPASYEGGHATGTLEAPPILDTSGHITDAIGLGGR